MRALLSAGALVDLVTTDNGASSLLTASFGGHLEVVRALLSTGVQLDLQETLSGRSPLFLACQHDHAEVALWCLLGPTWVCRSGVAGPRFRWPAHSCGPG